MKRVQSFLSSNSQQEMKRIVQQHPFAVASGTAITLTVLGTCFYRRCCNHNQKRFVQNNGPHCSNISSASISLIGEVIPLQYITRRTATSIKNAPTLSSPEKSPKRKKADDHQDDDEVEKREEEKNIYEWIDSANWNKDILGRNSSAEKGGGSPTFLNGPNIPKPVWTALGDYVSKLEKKSFTHAPAHAFICLRLDGHGFSKLIKKLRKQGIFPAVGYSTDFGQIMSSALEELMREFHAIAGFTQSDEITIILPAAATIEELKEEEMKNSENTSGKNTRNIVHSYSGRRSKLETLSAAFVTHRFSLYLVALCRQRGLSVEGIFDAPAPNNEGDVKGEATSSSSSLLVAVSPIRAPSIMFDCRMSMHSNLHSAFQLILWRAYDCSVNGVSTAVLHDLQQRKESKKVEVADEHAPLNPSSSSENDHSREMDNNRKKDKKDIQFCGTREKLLYLQEKDKLPLVDHEAYGTFVVRALQQKQGQNPLTGEKVQVERACLKRVPGPILRNWKNRVIQIRQGGESPTEKEESMERFYVSK